jgi:NAD(P)-dependent dehydrogenase (short-subunit alcohol dehydrogenase family)
MASPRTTVITGATRGIGRALLERLVAAGHRVEGCGTRADLADEVSRKTGANVERVDVASDAEVAAWARRVLERSGAPDLLVNNAAVINRSAPLWLVPATEFDRVVDVNIKGVANVLRHFAPAMIERGCGVIVNLSSGWGRSTSPDVAPYCTTKWAIEGLTQALSQELPRGMAAVALSPGMIHTQMLESCFGEEAKAHRSPEDWARTAMPFLLELGPEHNGKQMNAP